MRTPDFSCVLILIEKYTCVYTLFKYRVYVFTVLLSTYYFLHAVIWIPSRQSSSVEGPNEKQYFYRWLCTMYCYMDFQQNWYLTRVRPVLSTDASTSSTGYSPKYLTWVLRTTCTYMYTGHRKVREMTVFITSHLPLEDSYISCSPNLPVLPVVPDENEPFYLSSCVRRVQTSCAISTTDLLGRNIQFDIPHSTHVMRGKNVKSQNQTAPSDEVINQRNRIFHSTHKNLVQYRHLESLQNRPHC